MSRIDDNCIRDRAYRLTSRFIIMLRWEGVSDGLKVTAGSVIQRDDLVQYTATADATSSGGMLVAGFVTVTIVSVILAGIFSSILLSL